MKISKIIAIIVFSLFAYIGISQRNAPGGEKNIYVGVLCLVIAVILIISTFLQLLPTHIPADSKKQEADAIKNTQNINNVSQTSYSGQSIDYIETPEIIFRADGKPITDKETPYLQQISYNKAYAQTCIPQHIIHLNESYKLMCETVNPETLCTRYQYIKGIVNELSLFYEQSYYNDSESLEKYKNMVSDTNYCRLIQQCYDRYIQKASSELKTESGIQKRKIKFRDYIRENVDIQIYQYLQLN